MAAPTPRPLARTEVAKPDDDRPDTVERWQSAYQRALAEHLMIRPNLFGGPIWTVTSRTNPDLVYGTDGVRCGCRAGETGDPICKHRALFRAIHEMLPQPANVVPFPQRETPPSAA